MVIAIAVDTLGTIPEDWYKNWKTWKKEDKYRTTKLQHY